MTAHLGNRRWPRPQFVAIVASYWRRDTDPVDVAERLGVSVALVESIYRHCEAQPMLSGPAARAAGSVERGLSANAYSIGEGEGDQPRGVCSNPTPR